MKHLFLLALVLTACSEPVCLNRNANFEQLDCEDLLYKQELVKAVKADSSRSIRYFLEDYRELSGQPQLLIKITTDGLCAKAWMNVSPHTAGLQTLLNKKGKGYRGAELKELAYQLEEDSLHVAFTIEDVASVVD